MYKKILLENILIEKKYFIQWIITYSLNTNCLRGVFQSLEIEAKLFRLVEIKWEVWGYIYWYM